MEMGDNSALGSLSTYSIRNLLHRSLSTKLKPKSTNPRVPKSNDENTPPMDSNIQIKDPPLSPSVPKLLMAKSVNMNRSDVCVLPLEKEEIHGSEIQSGALESKDPAVKVFVRIRPQIDGKRDTSWTEAQISSYSLKFRERNFMFDSVFGSSSNQEDIFQSVGVPLVKNAMAGYNTTIMSYGQTRSGKTYTMWGPPSAMFDEFSGSSLQGIAPRIFQMILSEIQKKQENVEGKQINYQCRCSFLEVYNEQIGDLLDQTQQTLEIRDDPKNGMYVENLTEEYVTSYDDVTQILIKGLSSRKVEATGTNSKSSLSNIIFTFIIESWCKEPSSKCFSSSKTSRISLVDLVGLAEDKTEGVDRHCSKEAKRAKKSLSRLGHVVKMLKNGDYGDVPYRDSCLTHLLRESLGGNCKLTVICTIFPDSMNDSQTLKTLRFGEQVKSIRNEPVVNEISENDVNDLTDKIRQLKEELVNEKSDVVKSKSGLFRSHNGRENLNQLRVSLNRSLILPNIENDYEKPVTIDEEDVKELQEQLDMFHSYRNSIQSSVQENYETDCMSEEVDTNDLEQADIEEESELDLFCDELEPTLSESPKISNSQRKSTAIATTLKSENNMLENPNEDVLKQSIKKSEVIRSSICSSRILSGPTESLAASLHKGSQIIDYHQRNSVSNRSSVSFSFQHLTLRPCPEVDKVGSPTKTLVCNSCQQKLDNSSKEIVVAASNCEGPMVDRKEFANATNRETELETICKEQSAKIEQLNNLLEQYRNNKAAVNNEIVPYEELKRSDSSLIKDMNKLQIGIEKSETKEITAENMYMNEKEELLKQIQSLKSKLQLNTDSSVRRSCENLRSSLLSRSMQIRKSVDAREREDSKEELELERQRWMEMESDWISLTDELRIDIETQRRRAEKVEMELKLEKNCMEELDDALHRAVLGHGRIIEHYNELQEKYNDLLAKHRAMMGGIAEVKRAAEKAGKKGHGAKFAKSMAAELSVLRMEREREREFLRKENKNLKIQLRDTAEAVHAAGELLVRLREAEQSASLAEGNLGNLEQENEKLKKQIEKVKRKHKMEMVTMKQCIAGSKLPESALQPLYQEEYDTTSNNMTMEDDDQAWRAEFGAIYQEHHY